MIDAVEFERRKNDLYERFRVMPRKHRVIPYLAFVERARAQYAIAARGVARGRRPGGDRVRQSELAPASGPARAGDVQPE